MKGLEWEPAESITIERTAVSPSGLLKGIMVLSIAEYVLDSDLIRFWSWRSEIIKWYRKPGEGDFEMIVRVLQHEEFHRILLKTIDMEATLNYDSITECDLEGLP